MRSCYSHRWVFIAAAAGALYLGCTERNDVAQEKKHGSAGSGSGATDSGSSGAPGSAGSDGNEGGSDGSGSNGVSGAAVSDAGEPGAGTAGAGGDGSLGDASAIIVAGVVVTPQAVVGTSYVNGAWAPVKVIQEQSGAPQVGLGLALLPDGTGVAVMRGNSLFSTASWDGEWSTASMGVAPEIPEAMGRMALFPGGAFIAHVTPSAKVQLDTYDATKKSWNFLEDASQVVEPMTQPAVATVGAGEPLIAYYHPNHQYEWVRRVGNTWTEPATVPLMLGTKPGMFNPNLDMLKRVGVDQVVGVFTTEISELRCSLFQNGGWSSPERIATDASTATPRIHYTYLAALPDGRVALAYWTRDFDIKLGFFDGSHWSDFKVVPGAHALGVSPLGLSRGAAGAVVELLYSQQTSPQYQLRHMRLTNEANWTWTPPELVDGDHLWGAIAIAAAP